MNTTVSKPLTMDRWPIGAQLALGFLIVTALLLLTIIFSIAHTSENNNTMSRVVNFRVDTADADRQVLIHILKTMAALRNYMVHKDEKSLTAQQQSWHTIDRNIEEMTKLSELWTNPENTVRLHELKAIFKELRPLQIEIANTAHSNQGQTAEDMYIAQAVPYLERINTLINEMAEDQVNSLKVDAKIAYTASHEYVQKLWIILLISLIITSIVTTYITMRIKSSLSNTVHAANHIAAGDLEGSYKISGSTELALLGEAIISMRNKLKTREWMIKTQIALLNAMSGVEEVSQLGTQLLQFFFKHLDVPLGAFYLIQNRNLQVVSVFAQDLTLQKEQIKQVHRTLVDEAVAMGTLIHKKRLPPEYFIVSTGLGHLTPTELVVIPIFYANNPLCALEIAREEPFTSLEMDFLNSMNDAVGIAVNLCLSSSQTKALLEEVRLQAEELEQSNMDLERNAQELEEQQIELEKSNLELEQIQRSLEDERRKLENMNHELLQSQATLEATTLQATTANRYKSEFLANMSHELRTPLNSIMLLSNLLNENMEGNLNESQMKNASTINKSGADLLRLINDILDLAKVESGRLEMHSSKFTVDDLITNIESLFVESMKKHKLEFKIIKEQGIPQEMESDQKRVEQILRNFLSNSLKFTESGHVWLTIRRVRSEDPIPESFVRENALAFSVEDSGIGMPQDKLDLIFEAFQQLDGTLNRKTGGTGLGLSISRSLALKLGGVIVVASKEHTGSTFTLYLPTKAGDLPLTTVSEPLLTHREDASRLSTAKATQNVLVVEDDPIQLVHISKLITQNFKAKVTAASGEHEAWGHLTSSNYDCIVLDLVLSEGSGFELAKKITHDKTLCNIPIITYTAKDLSSEEYKSLQFSQGAVVLKSPESDARLRREISMFLYSMEQKGLVKKEKNKLIQIGHEVLLNKTVLVVDDDERNRYSLSEALKARGMKIIEAQNGQEALDILGNTPNIDIVLMDVMMPVLNGLETTRIIREDRRWQDLPIIALTAKAMRKDREDCLRAGVNDYLPKPIEASKLIALMKIWLSPGRTAV